MSAALCVCGRPIDKASLSPKRPQRTMRETADVAGAVCRLIAKVADRIADEDPDRLKYLIEIEREIGAAWEIAIDGLRRNHSDTDIGAELRVTKQAIQQRWPR